MTKVSFPSYVDEFVKNVEICLEHFELKLAFLDENVASLSKSYEVEGAPLKTVLLVYCTSRSFGQKIAEYRATMISTPADELGQLLNGKDAQFNRFATLGAVVSTQFGAEIRSQCLIQQSDTHNLAGVISASIAQAGQSIIHSVGKALNPELSNDDAVNAMSAWGDLDYEKLHYDYAHFGIGARDDRSWNVKLNMRHSLTLAGVNNNPFFGGGLLSLFRVPRIEFGGDDVLPIEELNFMEQNFGEAPSFGGWCDDHDDYVFTSFFPNYLKDLPGLTESLIDWTFTRSNSISQLVQMSKEPENE